MKVLMMIALSTKALIVRTIMEDRKALTMINVVKGVFHEDDI